MFEIFDDHDDDQTTITGARVYSKPDGSGELIKVRSFKSNENIQRKEDGPDCTISNNKFASVTLNEQAMKTMSNTQIIFFLSEQIIICNLSAAFCVSVGSVERPSVRTITALLELYLAPCLLSPYICPARFSPR